MDCHGNRMASCCLLLFFVFLKLISLSEEGCYDNFSRDQWNGTDVTDLITLINDTDPQKILRCTIWKNRQRKLFYNITSCFNDGLEEMCNQATEGNHTMYMFHFRCLFAKLEDVDYTNEHLNKIFGDCQNFSSGIQTLEWLWRISDGTSAGATSTSPTTMSTLPPTTTSTISTPTISTSPNKASLTTNSTTTSTSPKTITSTASPTTMSVSLGTTTSTASPTTTSTSGRTTTLTTSSTTMYALTPITTSAISTPTISMSLGTTTSTASPTTTSTSVRTTTLTSSPTMSALTPTTTSAISTPTISMSPNTTSLTTNSTTTSTSPKTITSTASPTTTSTSASDVGPRKDSSTETPAPLTGQSTSILVLLILSITANIMQWLNSFLQKRRLKKKQKQMPDECISLNTDECISLNPDAAAAENSPEKSLSYSNETVN
ncbi:cell wall integrity and stress response component 4-like isoform X7 [Xiphophorus hellerii]|uniref:cell wall integrity and stress response component 4-like isoform X7 n=1 Tax=Xiphophorus hellerii TaxID=8084 RepID=UPI0013B3DF34|nr:cell wall integrity and stress response component 4-like isoform X7 [Xiphophorus hellerii]